MAKTDSPGPEMLVWNGIQFRRDDIPKGVALKDCIPLEKWFKANRKKAGHPESTATRAALQMLAKEEADQAAAGQAAK